MKTSYIKKNKVFRDWYLIDATNLIVGRLATKISSILRGKNKSIYSFNIDAGDFVIVTNCEKVKFSGNKEFKKSYKRHTGYVGGIKSINVFNMRKRFPDRIILNAVRGMLPKNSLSKGVIKKLRIYTGSEHPHIAQKPIKINL
jgi:large subunit ribosomal protein L13